MKIYSWRSGRVSVVGVFLFLALLLSSCGGGGEPAVSENSKPAPTSQSESTEQDDGDAPKAELHDSLAAFPLPAGYEVPFEGSEYPGSDGLVTMAQTVIVPMPHMEVAKSIFAGFSDAGYIVIDRGTGFAMSADDIDPQNGGMIAFEDSNGVAGQVVLNVQGDKTGLNFNVYMAGTS